MTAFERRAGVTRMLARWLRLPMVSFTYGMEMLIRTMQEMQRTAHESVAVFAPAGLAAHTAPSEPGIDFPGAEPQGAAHAASPAPLPGTGITPQEDRHLSYDYDTDGLDKNLRDDMLKLVRYKILFVKREYEHAFPEQEDLVHDNMDGSAFTAWKVAEFIQELHRVRHESTPEGRARVGISLPPKWRVKKYPQPADEYSLDGYLTGFPPDDKKYLRVFYQVLDRFPREKFRYDERQIEVLEQIRDRIGEK